MRDRAEGATSPIETSPAVGETRRVGGDLDVTVSITREGAETTYRAGPSSIDTALPKGYPQPTPPGAIDLKSYPSVRRAEVNGTGHPDRGMNDAFWPLFRHIKRHSIAMTSPVEMTYGSLHAATASQPARWTMAFLYRTPELHELGADGTVTVRDADPVTVVAVGLRGDYSMALVDRGMEAIERWLGEHPEWQPAGEWRSLYYNGPTLLYWNKWAEVQLPVVPAPRRTVGDRAESPAADE